MPTKPCDFCYNVTAQNTLCRRPVPRCARCKRMVRAAERDHDKGKHKDFMRFYCRKCS